jgi:hypothetical protein
MYISSPSVWFHARLLSTSFPLFHGWLQETTRSFLSGSCADKEKFKLFMQATLLQSFCDNLNMAGVHVAEHQKLMQSILADYR